MHAGNSIVFERNYGGEDGTASAMDSFRGSAVATYDGFGDLEYGGVGVDVRHSITGYFRYENEA
ncbi:hypothetical protein NBRC116585_20030 [Thalassolituus maritimus]|uniref:Uncharacterized protein n=1 Tax=Thalassolituus maritimus TaxID=484498 RepID=A0ABQ0A0F5_9GAMM